MFWKRNFEQYLFRHLYLVCLPIAASNSVPVRACDNNMLRAMVGDHRPHNGVVLDCAPMAGTLPSAVDHLLPALSSRAAAAAAAMNPLPKSTSLLNPLPQARRGDETSASIPSAKRVGGNQTASGTAAHPTVWVAFDDVQDPQNLGAMLRSCLFFGVSAVIVPAKNSSPPSPTVSKASAGALLRLPRVCLHARESASITLAL